MLVVYVMLGIAWSVGLVCGIWMRKLQSGGQDEKRAQTRDDERGGTGVGGGGGVRVTLGSTDTYVHTAGEREDTQLKTHN